MKIIFEEKPLKERKFPVSVISLFFLDSWRQLAEE